MPEMNSFTYSHAELATILIKEFGLHEGHWAIYLEFGLMAGVVPLSPDGLSLAPAAIALVNKVGIQRQNIPNSLSVDASDVNPQKSSGGKTSKKSTGKGQPPK